MMRRKIGFNNPVATIDNVLFDVKLKRHLFKSQRKGQPGYYQGDKNPQLPCFGKLNFR